MKGLMSKTTLWFLLALTIQASGGELSVITSETGFYHVTVNGQLWLRSSQTFFYVNGGMYTTEGRLGKLGNLTLRNTQNDQGQDKLGLWNQTTFNYQAGDKPIQLYVKSYTGGGVNAVIFGQKYIEDTHGTRAPSDGKVTGGFPSFGLFTPAVLKLGYLSFGGNWLGDENKFLSTYDFNKGVNISDGFTGGALCMFDSNGNTLIISPFNQFMSASSSIDKKPFYDGYMHWGIMGSVDFIPAGFEYQTILYYEKGINKAFEKWGTVMRNWYGKADLRNSDITLSNLGYWTDEGSAYHAKPGEGKNYEDTILEIKSNMDQHKIPFKYIQLDDWFYDRDKNGGTVTWKAKNDSIPNGLTFLHNKTRLPVVLQNGFWSASTRYAIQNGGNFTFLMNGSFAVPIGEDFWDFLFSQAKSWGLTVYQQTYNVPDWMAEQTFNIPEFRTNVTLGRQWLMEMGKAAQKHGITIQYSGALPRHALQSLEISAVTQARVSSGYGRSKDQWKIGVTSIFANALGLAPFKDSFLSTTNTTNNNTSKMPERESMVATLSTGPVGPGDRINTSNYALSSESCCNKEGLILGPSKPATAIDLQIMEVRIFMEAAYNNSMGPSGEVWTTYSLINGYKFGIIFSSLVGRTNVTVKGSDLFGSDIPESKLHTLYEGILLDFSTNSTLLLCCNYIWPFYTVFYTAPVFRIGPHKTEIILLGEAWKHVPMSAKRVQSIRVTSDVVTVTLIGVSGEEVSFYYAVNGDWNYVHFVFGSDRRKIITVKPAVTTTTTPTTTPFVSSSYRPVCSVMLICLFVILI